MDWCPYINTSINTVNVEKFTVLNIRGFNPMKFFTGIYFCGALASSVCYLTIRPSLVYCLFPILLFSKTEAGRRLLFIYYANVPRQSVYVRRIVYQMHFIITVMLKISFLHRIASPLDFWLDDQFWCDSSKLMRAVIGNN